MRTARPVAFVAVICLLLASAPAAGGGAPTGAKPNIVLITIDTLRADRVGCYGYAAARTPALDELAARGTRFDQATAHAPLTVPSHVSILTGQLPPAHGVRDNGAHVLDPGTPTVASLLRDAGYRTAAFVGSVLLSAEYGFDAGFQHFDDEMPSTGSLLDFDQRRSATAVVDRASAWLRDHKSEPFFAWIHFYDAHAPYPNGYDAGVAAADRGVAAEAPAADVAAAANIAARFGFETSALTLPLGATDAEIAPGASPPPLVLVGKSNALVARLVREGKVDRSDLQPGQGAMAIVTAPFGGNDAVVVAGADDEGIATAAAAMSARLPFLWQLRATTIARVESDVREFLASRSVSGAAVTARRAVYGGGHDYTDRLELRVRVADGQIAAATAALKEIADAHGVGKAVFTDRQADRLNYSELGALDLRVSGRAGDREQTIVIPRFGPPYRNAFPNNPWRPAPRPLSLANLYTDDGVLLDARGHDLIPDQTATTLVLDDGETGLVGAIDIAARIGMESTGVDLPLAKIASQIKDPSLEPNPILIGRKGSLLRTLGVAPPSAAGEGIVRIVPRAFGPFPAIVVTGADAAGVRAAANHLAAQVP